ncbi:MAG: peptide-binding protein [Thermodesulfobacteriota bacterium]|nr:peptide-binding protein [Thermodesulfobacteriota bacterium]
MKAKLILIFSPLFILSLLSGSFFLASRSPRPVLKQLIISSIGDASFLNPILAQDSSSSDICGFVFNGLLKYDRNLEIIGDLAERWEITKTKKPVITFHLRKNVLWHDGVKFTAQDALFTYKKIMDKNTNTVRRSDFMLIDKAEAIDPYTFCVTYKEPFSPALEAWTIGIIPEHILAQEDINTSKFNRNPVGTGPFVFREWVSDEKIVLTVNENYFEGKPKLDRIVYRILPETSISEIEFLTGGLDYYGVSPHQYSRMQGQKDIYLFKKPSLGYTYIGYNLKNPLFKDRRVRMAFDHAINKKEIVEYILYGLGEVATGPFPNHLWYSNKGVKPNFYSPEKARALLKESGWEDKDGDGIVEKEGKSFKFTLITNSGNDMRKDIGVLSQRYLREIGIDVKFELYEWSVFLKNKINPKNFDACILGWGLSVDPDCYQIWHSSQIKSGFNFISYKNPEVDRLLTAGRREYDMQVRKEIYWKVHELIAFDQPYTFLYVPLAISALSRRFVIEKGGELSPVKMEKGGIFHDLIWWKVKGEEEIRVY